MSLYTRILRRAAVAAAPPTVQAWPKGSIVPDRRPELDEGPSGALPRFPTPALARRSEDEDLGAPVHRSDDEDATGTAGPGQEEDALRPQREEEEEVPRLRRAVERAREPERPADDAFEARTVRREAPEEDAVEPLRRAPESDEVEALRRSGVDEEEEEDARVARALRRSGAATPWGAAPVDAAPAPFDAPEDELPDLRALRREVGATVAGPHGGMAAAGPPDAGAVVAGPFGPAAFEPPNAAETPAAPLAWERPRVTIDQIDVVIHDAAPATSRAAPSLSDLSRRMRSLYLRRL